MRSFQVYIKVNAKSRTNILPPTEPQPSTSQREDQKTPIAIPTTTQQAGYQSLAHSHFTTQSAGTTPMNSGVMQGGLTPHTDKERNMINTPIKADVLSNMLGSFYDKMYVVQGLTEGFKIEFKGSVDSFEANNSISAN